MNRCVELLAGAGNMDSARAALSAGCDAVYLGLREFGARRMADNFTFGELDEFASVARKLNKKVYLTVNTLVKENETAAFLEQVRKAREAGIDAVIMQDVGMMDLVSGVFPDLPIHASTQANVHNSAAFALLKTFGVRRVILSRECTLDEIRALSQKGMQTEVFVFGALCSAVSGVCYMSSFATDRSGNRGLCTQMCRLEYGEPGGRKGFFLSTRDISMIPLMNDYLASGVSSLKIEGRGRSAAYVYNATGVLRKAIDLASAGRLSERAIADLAADAARTYNRSFCTGYSSGRAGADVIDSLKNGNRGLKVAGKPVRFDPLRRTVELRALARFAKNDVLCLEDAAGARASFSIAAMRDTRGRIIFEARPGDTVELTCAQKCEPDQPEGETKAALSGIVPEAVFLIYSEEASSIRKIRFEDPSAASAAPPAAKRRTALRVAVTLSEGLIRVSVDSDRGRFDCDEAISQCFPAEKNPLDSDTVFRTLLQFDRARFDCRPEGFSFSSGMRGYFVPLSVLKRAGKQIFSRFVSEYDASEHGVIEKAVLTFPGESDCVARHFAAAAAPEALPEASDIRLSLFTSENVPDTVSGSFSQIAFSSDHFFDAISLGGLDALLARFGNGRARLAVELSPVVFESGTARFVENLSILARSGVTHVIAGNLAHFALISEASAKAGVKLEVSAGQQLNSVNLRTLLHFISLGAVDVEISYELGGPEIISLLKAAAGGGTEGAHGTEGAAEWALKYFRVRLFGNLQVANFAYDIFARNPGLSFVRHYGPQDRRFKFTELSFENGSHYVVRLGAERSVAYSSGVLNNTLFTGAYLASGVGRFSVSLFNYSKSFERDLAAAVEFSRRVGPPLAPGSPVSMVSPIPFGVVKDRTLA